MRTKGRKVLKDWGFIICILVFGGIYGAIIGLPGMGISLPLITGERDLGNLQDIGDAGQQGGADPALADGSGDRVEENAGLTEDGAIEDSAAAEGEIAENDAAADPGKVDGSGEIVYLTVEDDYFADALFIGDSRTVGMYEYGGLEEISTFFCSTGLTVYRMFSSEIVNIPGQKRKQTVEEALSQRQFSAIYLMLGINELGTGTVESFAETYRAQVEHLQELQPDAVIYLQSILKVTNERSSEGDYITNEGIEARNAEIAKLENGKRIFYLDVNPVICDESGGMTESYTNDGVHLKAQYISIWKDYLKCHVVQVKKN